MSRVTPAPAKITSEAMRKAMSDYAAFYRLNVDGTRPGETRKAIALLHKSLGLEGEAVECLFDNAPQLIPDYGELEPLFLGAIWLGAIVGLSAAANANEDATWAESTPNTPGELLERAKQQR